MIASHQLHCRKAFLLDFELWQMQLVDLYTLTVCVLRDTVIMCVADHSVQKAVFGCPLEDHLQHAGGDISIVIQQCVMALLKYGLNEEVRTLTCTLSNTLCFLTAILCAYFYFHMD